MAQKVLKGDDEVFVYVDNRELKSKIVKELYEKDVQIKPVQLHVADFQVSERVGIERKSINDFLSSLIDGRLFDQAKRMKESFEKPIILLVGNDDIYSMRNIDERSIRGAIISLIVDSGIPVLRVDNDKDAANYIWQIARREQLDLKKSVQIRGAKKGRNSAEEQEYVVAGLPNVGSTLAKNLLKEFGSLEGIFTAKENELQKVDKIGPKKARRIWKLVRKKYE
ncbi:ERCC4 domain-containing protein [Candidatus Undinarchaeota archaeon]